MNDHFRGTYIQRARSGRAGLDALLTGAALFVALLSGMGAAVAEPAGNPTEHFNWTDINYKGKDAAGGELQKGDEPMSPPMILMLVNFGIVLIIIGWKVRPPVMRYVRKRHETIKEALEEAARLRAEAKRKLDEYTEKVSEAEAEVDRMIKEIRADAEAEKKRIIADADAQARALKRDAEARIAAEIERARASLEREVIAVAIAAAEKMIRAQATTADQTRLIDTFISDVQSEASGSKQERV
jgi:F-type H+-transporting ATPase subunit b